MKLQNKIDITKHVTNFEHVSIPNLVKNDDTHSYQNKKIDTFKKLMVADFTAILGTVLLTTNMLLGLIILGPAIIALLGLGLSNITNAFIRHT